MVAVKENRAYTINEADIKSFTQAGYDVLDDNGNVIAYGAGKTIAWDKHMALMAEKDAEIEKLKAEIEKAEVKKTKKG